ncbi:hypothetical protein SCWH03_51980 [Streptomyces pacificus]|uniref:Uncharacterized protein n=1 Tax=Streptomyces pacificus TaxID=2705029 RepID=A0A6A0B2J9_9ACTN|nr:hypothetical protein SCWH03_51980 [Streptomyces pacificus]
MLTRSDSSPPESAVGTTPALPPGGGRRMSGGVSPGITADSPPLASRNAGLRYLRPLVTLREHSAALGK